MAIYTVQDTTMTALGDAVRSKVIGTTELPVPISKENVSGNPYNLEVVEFPIFVKTVIVTGRVYDVDISDMSPQGILHNLAYASGVYTRDLDLREASDFTVINPNWAGIGYDFEIIVKSNALTFTTERTYNSWQRTFVYDYTAIGLDENGNEFKYTPAEMVDEINNIYTDGSKKLPYVIAHPDTYLNYPTFNITAKDLTGVTQIGMYAFYNNRSLASIEIPEGIRYIGQYAFSNCSKLTFENDQLVLPSTLNELGSSVFEYVNIKSVKILNKQNVISIPFNTYPFSTIYLKTLYVPSHLYNDYCNNWSQYLNQLQPYGEWVFDKNLNTYLEYDTEKEYSISLLDFKQTPDFSITLDKNECAEITDISINDDNTEIIFKVKALNSEGVETLTVTIYGEEQTFTLTGTITVVETIPEPTYEVVAVDGASYGFTLNDNGYYESQNKGKSSTYALCQVNINNPIGLPVYFDCINSGEANYDYGILGVVNQTLSKSTTDDSGVKKNFRGASSTNIQTVEYTDAGGDCFIQIKYKKDGSGDQGNDTLQFKIRFGE